MKIHLSLHLRLTIVLCFLSQLLYSQSSTINLDEVISGNRLYEPTQKITLSQGFKYSQQSGSNFKARIVQPNGGSYSFTEPTQSTTLPINTSYPVGTTPGMQGVSPTGAGTYAIPIKVCPGVAGMEPGITIAYNSQSGEGLLGLGWSMAGLSSITRTASNWYHEGYINNIQFNANDHFILDGQRLISISASEYRTEIESFSKITIYGTASDPSYFKVETKDGKTLYYGNTADSRIEAQGRTQAISWNLNRIEDKNGNYITITYYENQGIGEFYPLTINYTGTTGAAPFNTIEFIYQTRTVPLVSYVAGSKLTTTKLLQDIYVKNEGTTASRYQLLYNTTTSRLTEIVEYGKNNARLNSTLVNWGTASTGIVQTTAFSDSQLTGRYHGDFDGDGRTDLVMIKGTTWYRYLAGTTGNFSLQTSGTMPTNFNTSAPHNQAYPGDYNGDGKMDLLVFRLQSSTYYLSFLISTGTGFTAYNYSTPFSSSTSTYYTGDFNGDGLDDLMIKTTGTYNCLVYGFNVTQLTFSLIGRSTISWGNQGFAIIKEVPLDINGNGKNDLMVLDQTGCRFYELTDGTTNLGLLFSSSYPTINHVNLFGDFNGDGKTDLFSFDTNNNWRVNTSTGTGFIQTTNTTFSGFNPFVSYNNFFARDMNGDGRGDLVVVGRGTITSNPVRIYVGYSDGQAFSLQTYTPSTTLSVSPDYNALGDFNGDGTVDYYYNNGSTGRIYTVYRGRNQDFVASVRNGLGVDIGFTYKPLSDDGIYTRGSEASYPVMTFQGPLYVAASAWTDNIDNTLSTTSYTYQSARIHRQGKGFLGFKSVTSSNPVQNVRSVNSYEYDPSYYNVYLKSRAVSTDDNSPVSVLTNTQSLIVYSSKRILPYISQSVFTDNLTNTTKTTSSSIDSNGNPTTVTETFNDGSYNTTTYSNYSNAGTWLPTRPQNVTVTRKHYQDALSFSLATTFTYQSTTGLILTKVTGPLTTSYLYNGNGTLSQTTLSEGASNRVTRFEYDSRGRFATKIYNALNHLTQQTFDNATGNMLTQTAPNGKVTSYSYDNLGKLTSKVSPTGQNVTIAYQWATGSRPKNAVFYTLTTSAGLPSVKEYYDAFGRVLRTEETGFNSTPVYISSVYNTRGLMIQQSYPYYSGSQAYAREFTYDVFGRPGTDSGPSDIVMYAYSGKTTERRREEQTWSGTVDAQGNLVSALDNGGAIAYTYKSVGKPGVVSSNGASCTMVYDSYGRQTELTDPNTGTTTYQYNGFGEITSQIDARSNTYMMSYDLLGRITARTSPDGTTTYSYDPTGNPGLLRLVTYSGGSESYTYDTYGRLAGNSKTIEGVAYPTNYGYDNLSRITSLTYPSGFSVTNVYNTYGYLSQVKRTDNSAMIWQGNTVNAFGQYTGISSGNGRTTSKSFSDFGLLQNISTNTVQSLSYNFDPVTGNLLSRTDNLRSLSESFTYDDLNRLTEVTGPSSLTVGYSTSGNITSKTGVGNYTYSTQPHAVTQVTNPQGLIPTVDQNITYTPFNKTAQITEGNLRVQFSYGYDLQRTSSKLYQNEVLQKTVHYLDGYEKEVSGNNTRQLHYIGGGEGLAAIYEINNGTGSMYYVHTDHLGSYDAVTNQSGVVVQNYSFDAWGRRRNPSNWTFSSVPTNYLFNRGYTGHEHLDQFSLINMNGRMYDPLLGKMLAADNYVQAPGFTQSFNRYAYCMNNPLIYTDPTGEFVWAALPLVVKIAIGVGAGIGAYSGYKIGEAKGATGLGMVGYVLGGTVIGGFSGYLGGTIAAGGGIMANTGAIMVSSYTNSMGMTMLSGGDMAPSISFGVASFNFGSGEWGHLGKKGNSNLENIGYGLGFLGNIADLINLPSDISNYIEQQKAIKAGTTLPTKKGVELVTNNEDWVSHAEVAVNGNTDISWGPTETSYSKIEYLTNINKGTNSYHSYYSEAGKTLPHLVVRANKNIVTKYGNFLNKSSLPYNAVFSSCSTHASIGLNLAGAFNLGFLHPYLLHYQLMINPALYSTSYLWQNTK